jgi:Sporulation and spore germination
MRRLATATALLVFMGCGTTTTTKGFQPIDNKAINAAFLETPTTTTTIAPPRPAPTTVPTTLPPTTLPPTTIPSEDAFLYFVTAEGKLKQVRKRRPLPIVPLEVVSDLFKPTDPTLKTSVTNGLVQSVKMGKITTVALNPSYGTVAEPDKLLLIGQITLTLTMLRGISQVQYMIEGGAIDVPTYTVLMPIVGQDDYAVGVVK